MDASCNSSTSSGGSQQQPHEPELKLVTESSVKTYVLDVVKEFKSNGNFDKFRKECFNEIIAQVDFVFF
jgi:hypothetical protein